MRRTRYANSKSRDPRLEMADGEYMLLKAELRNCGNGHAVTIRKIERQFKLKAGSLANYRANTDSRQ